MCSLYLNTDMMHSLRMKDNYAGEVFAHSYMNTHSSTYQTIQAHLEVIRNLLLTV